MPVVNHSLQLIAIEFVVHNSCGAALQRGEIIDYVHLLCVWLIAKLIFSHNDCEILFNNYFLMRCFQSLWVCTQPNNRMAGICRTVGARKKVWDREVRLILRQMDFLPTITTTLSCKTMFIMISIRISIRRHVRWWRRLHVM